MFTTALMKRISFSLGEVHLTCDLIGIFINLSEVDFSMASSMCLDIIAAYTVGIKYIIIIVHLALASIGHVCIRVLHGSLIHILNSDLKANLFASFQIVSSSQSLSI